jgi:hypothetical protein
MSEIAKAERGRAARAKRAAVAEDLQRSLALARDDARRRASIAELKRLNSAENRRQDSLKIIHDLVVVAEPPKLTPAPKPPARAPRQTSLLLTGDWQVGQYTKLGPTGGVFEQTTKIAQKQVADMWAVAETLHRLQSAAKHIDELVLFDLGDMVEGDQMRPSQAAEIDAPVTRQAVDVFDLQAWLLNQALALFPKFRFLKVPGNHDRTSSKPGNAGLGELGYIDSYSWLLGEMLRRMFERSIDSGRLTMVNHESFYGTAIIANMRCVYEHGSSFKTSTGSYGGVPFYPIANAARGYKEMLDGADLVIFAHHHKAMVLPMNGGWGWQVCNGALPPSSSWIQSNFKGYGRPMQWMLDLHHEKGVTGWHPIYLEQPEHVRPGNFWKQVKG